jgi:hypothetical protein
MPNYLLLFKYANLYLGGIWNLGVHIKSSLNNFIYKPYFMWKPRQLKVVTRL